jgi:hypothetical protein
MAIHKSGDRKVRGFIVYPIGLMAAKRLAYPGNVLEFIVDMSSAAGQQPLPSS